ncbi:uncharacterized protein [Panulirus ornatus]|uniref:uncharacterized protein isoform X2 n=1 Tax=Panulirus ornatus TaxID=150431 RepID=UPI003A858267
MSRRKESLKERLRAEEHELDKQLREAGLYEEGMEVEMKRMMLQMLEESRKSAEQEEHQRQQLKQEEDQIFNETLSRSFRSNAKEKHEGEVGSSKQHGNEENSRDSDVVAIPLDDGDPDCISGSGSVTPDFDHLCSGSPELMIPNVSPSIPSSIDSSAPAESGSYPLRGKTGGSSAKPHSSEEDLFCDSEGSEVLKTVNRAPKNFQQIGEITNSDVQKKATRKSGLVDIVKKDGEKHESDSITSSAEDQGNFINKYQGLESRRPLRRRSSIEIVPSPSSKSEECSKRQIQHHSQPLFSSSDSRNSLGAEIEEEDGVQLISPVVRHRRSLGSSTTSNDIKNKGTSLQDAEVSNSLEVQVVQQTPGATAEGDESFLLPTPSASQSSDSRFQDHEVPSPMVSDPLSDDRQKILQSQKRSQKEDPIRNEGVLQRSQVDICSTTDFSSKLNDEEEKENICSYMALSEHENLSFNYKKDRKRNINVFFVEETPDVPLKRRRIEKTEVPSQAYFRKIKECPKDCVLRIMNMIDHMMRRIEKHQAENIYHKMKWPVPLTVDKRLKDSIDRPKVQSRRYITELETGVENEQMPRTPRLANKGTESFENASDDSLPDICQNDGSWIDTQEKKRGKKRGLHLGLSRKQPKLMALLEGKEGMQSSNQSNEKIIVYESDDDPDDFEIFPSNSTRQKPSACGQLELERYSTPKKDSKMECSEVSSSKVCDNIGDRNIKGVSNTEKIQIDSQISEEGNLIDLDKRDTIDENELYRKTTDEKRQMTDSPELSEVISKNKQGTSAESKVTNQPQRRSFMLTSDDSDDQSKASGVAASSTYSVQKLGTTKLQGFVSNMQRSTEQLRQQHTGMLRKLENCASGKQSLPAVKRDNSGRKINDLTHVSSSGRESFESLAGPSSSADICIVDDNSSTGAVSVESAKHVDKNPRRNKTNRDPIRPAPLKLKKNRMGNKRETETSGNQLKSEIGAERITSSEGLTVQEFSDVEQIDNSIEKEDDGEEMVSCPLCQKFFPAEMIEVHASDCSEQAESPQKRACQLREVSGKVRRKRVQREMEDGDIMGKQLSEGKSASGITIPGEIRPTVGQEKCSFCKKMFKEGDEYGIHVQSCESMKDIQDSIISPVGTRTPGNKREVQHSSGHTPKRGMTATNVRTGNLFDHLEESKEEYEIPTSPIKNFIPISKQTDSLIDYHHQFRDKSRKLVMAGAVGAGAVRRGHKRRGTRKAEDYVKPLFV